MVSYLSSLSLRATQKCIILKAQKVNAKALGHLRHAWPTSLVHRADDCTEMRTVEQSLAF